MSTHNRRFAVLEINGIVQNLMNLMDFVVDNNPTAGLQKQSRIKAIDLIHKLTVTAVNWRLAHNPYGDYDDAIIELLFGKAKITDERRQIYRQLSDNPMWCGITNDIERQVSHHIEINTYKDWKVIRVGTLIGLAEGQDYRISEYYRLNPEQRENDQAIITLDASNPVNYLLGQFNKEFGPRLHGMLTGQIAPIQQPQLATRIIEHKDFATQVRLQGIQRHNQSMIQNNADENYKTLVSIYENTSGYIAAMFVDCLIHMYPQVELAYNAPTFNSGGLYQLGVWNLDKFRTEYLQRVISAFGLSYFTAYLKKNKRYTLEYSSNNVLAIYEKVDDKPSAIADMELLQSFIAGDRLTPEETRHAQELYEDASRRGLI